jgi:hypothetical protein
MLLKLSQEINDCYARASEARIRAKRSLTPQARDDFYAMESRWLRLAKSYEFVERLELYLEEADKFA